MSHISTVTSPFNYNNTQLFYEATLNNLTHKVTIRMFNHKGVLKVKKIINIPEYIVEIFGSGRYLVGLSSDHINLCVYDSINGSSELIIGSVTDKNGLHKEMNEKNLKFRQFYYDNRVNFLLAILGDNHIFIITLFEPPKNYSMIQNQLPVNLPVSNKILQIRSLYISDKPIDKMEFKKSQRRVISNQKQNKKNNRMMAQQEQSSSSEEQSFEIITYLCLLFKLDRNLRIIEFDWQKQKVVSIEEQGNVQDFCFREDWELLMIYEQERRQQQQGERSLKKKKYIQNQLENDQGPYKVSIKSREGGQFELSVSLSQSHLIYCSKQSLYIVDPSNNLMFGVHEALLTKTQQCEYIPSDLKMNNSMIMVSKTDKLYQNFIFEIFRQESGEFQYKSILVPIYDLRGDAIEEMSFKKNIEKIFTINGLIHPNFREKASEYLRKYRNKNAADKFNESNSQPQINMQIQDSQKLPEQFSDDQELAGQFLKKFVLKEQPVLNRLISKLLKYEKNKLFNTISMNIIDIQDNSSDKSGCNFYRWNKHLQKLIEFYVSNIYKLFFLSDDQSIQHGSKSESRIRQSSLISENLRNQIQVFYEQNLPIKTELAAISNIYNIFLQILIVNSSKQIRKNEKQILNYYQKLIRQNIKRCRSLFLVYDIFSKISQGRTTSLNSIAEATTKIQQIISKIFVDFQQRKQKNINESININKQQNKRYQQYDSDNIIPSLLLYEYFEKAQAYLSEENSQSKSKFDNLLEFFLMNLNNFQENAYFYYLICNELYIRQHQDHHQSLQKPKQYVIYPYMSKDLVKFFQLLSEIPEIPIRQFQIPANKHKNKELQQNLVNLTQLSIRLALIPFMQYAIQLSVYYNKEMFVATLLSCLQQQFVFSLASDNLAKGLNQPNGVVQSSNQNYYKINKFVIQTALYFRSRKLSILCFQYLVRGSNRNKYSRELFKQYFRLLIKFNELIEIWFFKDEILKHSSRQINDEFQKILEEEIGSKKYNEFNEIIKSSKLNRAYSKGY